MYEWLVPRIVVPLYELVSGHRPWTELRRLQALEWRRAEELEARCLSKLRTLLAHAEAQVPYYRELFERAGVRPGDVRGLSDLSRLPPSTKADLRARFPAGVVAGNIPSSRRYEISTSGSSGMPLRFFTDRADVDGWVGSYLFFRDWAGVQLWDTRVRIAAGRFNPNPARLPRMAHWARRVFAGERLVLLSGSQLSAREFRELTAQFSQNRRYFVWAHPSYANRLASQLLERAIDLPSYPKSVITSAETLTDVAAANVRRAFRCPVVNHYSTWEVPHLAQTCPDNSGALHVNSERVILRVVRDDGSPAEPGEEGRVLLTSLANYVMPFINYDLGDRAVAGSSCLCGRGFPTVGGIVGRSVEMIHTPDGRAFSSVAFSYALPAPVITPYVSEYQAVQTAPDAVVVRLVPTTQFTAAFSREAQRRVEALLGPAMSVSIETVDHIAVEESGKRLVIKSKLRQADQLVTG